MVTTLSNNSDLFAEFHLPEQNLKKLSFCSHKPKPFHDWLESLPLTQINHVSVVFYKLLPEINHLNINADQRLTLLNDLRPHIHLCIEGLANDFLKQSLNMTDNMTKIAAVAQALQRHLCDGYMLAIKALLQTTKRSTSDDAALSQATYYAIHGLGQLLYRCYQLYIPRPPAIWRKLNQLQQIAIDHQFNQLQIHDDLLVSRTSLSCEHAYTRLLVLACSNTNQLRQVDILHLYNALEQWSSMTSSPPITEDEHSIYWIDKASDNGPFYKTRYKGDSRDSLYTVNLQPLIDLLDTHQSQSENSNITEIPVQFRQSLIAHLLACWQEKQERRQPRRQSNIELEVCIGLKAAHQQLLQGRSFDEFLGKSNSPNIPTGFNRPTTESINYEDSSNGHFEDGTRANSIQVTATDISDDGYCLRWERDIPPQIKSGEMVLLRKQDCDRWYVGTIRWAQRLNRNTYVGVQILPGYAEASAASTTLDNGTTTPFFRTVILRGDNNASGDSLLTPAIPFALQQNIELHANDHCDKAKLTHLWLNSGTVSQYSYRSL